MHGPSKIGAVMLAALVAACSGTAPPSATPGPASAAPSPTADAIPSVVPTAATAEPSPIVTSAPSPAVPASYWSQNPPEPLLIGSAVRVLVAELNIRESASTAAKRVDTFRADQVILVNKLFPPVEADGYVWYRGSGPAGENGELPALPNDPHAGTDPSDGWFAARKGSTRYVAAVKPRCSSAVDVVNLGAMLPAERLACFGDRSIEFEASYRSGCPTCEIFGTFEPAWIGDPNELNWAKDNKTGHGIDLRFPPGSARPDAGSIIRVHGHFNDPAAARCSMTLVADIFDMTLHPVAASIAELRCRQLLVVERFEVLGSDSSFDPEMPFD